MPIVTRSIHHHHHIFDVSIVKYPYIRVPLVRSNVTSKKFNAFIKQLSAADSLTQINVDFECVSIQWLWLCVLLLLYVFFSFASLSSFLRAVVWIFICQCSYLRTVCSHSLHFVSREDITRERELVAKKDRKIRVLPLTANHRRNTDEL